MSATIGHVQETLAGHRGTGDEAEANLYSILRDWGFEESSIERGRTGIDVSGRIRQRENEGGYAEHLEQNFGTRHPFLAAAAAGKSYKPGQMASSKTIKGVEAMAQKNVVDAGTVQDAVPIIVDPMIIDVQRQRAPVLDRIDTQSQQGFTAQYNILSDRSPPIGYAGQSDVIDLSDNDYGDFTIETDSEDMRIFVDQINVSDFASRATDSLDYMDLENTTLGQRTIEWALTKAAAYFYADPDAGETDFGYSSLGTDNAFPGMTHLAQSAGNDIDRTGVDVDADGFPVLEDLKAALTWAVEGTGLTYADAEIFVSPSLFDLLENEANPVTRLDSFSEGADFGARQLWIKGVRVTECPNIMPNFELPWDASPESPGNAFIIDRRSLQFRALAPLFTLPLGRDGLADKAAMAEYGTLIDKSHGEHTFWLEYDLGEVEFDPDGDGSGETA
ncbi:uncharacterized protein Nmag_1645 [Natrialba magadii ATCC 43099]|uniref:Uncharacterized protein n=2 Tax=Natrialba magadii (strain ATCC 43099 / DSM 3394 / CCM 3739 / CIP 104546 / IAM 13178 / JCM 8861 / NBRC 102185 / NCIMB 2190 / MS3) TaxID=547559 RepID=D3SUG3_NATMM|nr:hypothetical protein [Natrialba magadii]ADD05221.1 uncharacterized protein Nmag_1645 [Natrialba magadii ATCC 43099]